MTLHKLSLITATLLLTTHTFAQTNLADIVVTTTNKLPTTIEKTTSNISVITSEEIAEKGYLSVAEALNGIAGISVASSGGLGQPTSLFVRGADGGKILVLLDGMRLNDPSSTDGRALLDTLMTDTIQQIEVLKGGASSIWGSNASAGVINIISKEAKQGVHGSVGVTYGSYQTTGVNTALSYKDEKITAQILASYLDTDSYSALAPHDAESDGYNNQSINLKLGYIFNANNKVKLSYNTIATKTDFDDPFSTNLADDSYSHATAQQDNIALDYLFRKDAYSATFHASKGKYERDYYTTGSFGDAHNAYQATLDEYSLINGYTYSSGKAILGLEYKNIDGFNQYNSFDASQSDYSNEAIYLSNLYDINERTLLETNLRYDAFSEFDNKLSYKVGLKHQHTFVEGFTTSANYYTSYDAPSAYQLANVSLGSLLKPSYTQGYDISANYKELINISYFHSKVEDSIDYISDPVSFVGGYSNINGTSTFSGLEIEGKHQFSAYNLILSANYTHLFDFEKEDGTNLSRRAKDTLNASLDYYTANDMHFGIDTEYVGDRLDTDGGFPVASSVSTGNYTLWHLHFSTKIMDNMDLNIHAKNIFDEAYQSVYSYATEGRSFYATLKYSF